MRRCPAPGEFPWSTCARSLRFSRFHRLEDASGQRSHVSLFLLCGWLGSTKSFRQSLRRVTKIARFVLQRLDRQTPHRTRNADGTDNLAAKIVNGHGRTTHFVVELPVVESNARAANLVTLPPQALLTDNCLRRHGS